MIQSSENKKTIQKDPLTGKIYIVNTMIRRREIDLVLLNTQRAQIVAKKNDFVNQSNKQIEQIDKLISDISAIPV